MGEPNILAALREKLRPGPDLVIAAPKMFSPETLRDALMTKRSGAEARLADATRTHQKGALDVEKGVPGAAGRKAEAAAALREAEEYIRDVMGAQIEVETEVQEVARQKRTAEDRDMDAKTLAAAERCAEAGGKVAAMIPGFTVGCAEFGAARLEFRGLTEGNPRMHGILEPVSYEELITREILRTAPIKINEGALMLMTPPGMKPVDAGSVRMAGFRALKDDCLSALEAVRIRFKKAEAARAKEGRR